LHEKIQKCGKEGNIHHRKEAKELGKRRLEIPGRGRPLQGVETGGRSVDKENVAGN